MGPELPEAAEAFLRDLALPEDQQPGARNGLVALLKLVRCRTLVWAAQEQARRAAQEWPLPLTAETFLVCHVTQRLDLATARADLAALLETVRAEAAPRWTPTAKAMPEEGVPVLACRERRQAVATWDGWHWRSGGTRCSQAWFSYWQPLPPGPPEEGETNES